MKVSLLSRILFLFTSHPAPSLAPFIFSFLHQSHTWARTGLLQRGPPGLSCRQQRLWSQRWAVATPGLDSAPWTATLQYRPHTHTHTEASQCNTNTGQAAVTLRGLILLHCAAVFYGIWASSAATLDCLMSEHVYRLKPISISQPPESSVQQSHQITHTHTHTYSRSHHHE